MFFQTPPLHTDIRDDVFMLYALPSGLMLSPAHRTLNLQMPLTLRALGSGYTTRGWFQHPPGHFSQALIKTQPPGSKTPAFLQLKWSQVSTSPNICPTLHLQQMQPRPFMEVWRPLNQRKSKSILQDRAWVKLYSRKSQHKWKHSRPAGVRFIKRSCYEVKRIVHKNGHCVVVYIFTKAFRLFICDTEGLIYSSVSKMLFGTQWKWMVTQVSKRIVLENNSILDFSLHKATPQPQNIWKISSKDYF